MNDAQDRQKENEAIAVSDHGWKWMAWHGISVKGTPNYPEKQMVRCLMSPKRRKHMRTSAEWKRHWQKNGDTFREAIGDEPLEYGYCSSQGGPEVVPDFIGRREIAERLTAKILDELDSWENRSEKRGPRPSRESCIVKTILRELWSGGGSGEFEQ